METKTVYKVIDPSFSPSNCPVSLLGHFFVNETNKDRCFQLAAKVLCWSKLAFNWILF